MNLELYNEHVHYIHMCTQGEKIFAVLATGLLI